MPQSGQPARKRPQRKSGPSSGARRNSAAPEVAAGDPHAEALSAGARFAAVFDSISNVAIQGFTRDGSVRHWNPASQALCGYTEAEVFGHKIHDLLGFGPQEKRRFLSEVKRSWQTGEALPPAELAIRTKTGEVRWVYSTMLPVSEAGQVVEVSRLDDSKYYRLVVE